LFGRTIELDNIGGDCGTYTITVLPHVPVETFKSRLRLVVWVGLTANGETDWHIHSDLSFQDSYMTRFPVEYDFVRFEYRNISDDQITVSSHITMRHD
jgi:hypothetical protein